MQKEVGQKWSESLEILDFIFQREYLGELPSLAAEIVPANRRDVTAPVLGQVVFRVWIGRRRWWVRVEWVAWW